MASHRVRNRQADLHVTNRQCQTAHQRRKSVLLQCRSEQCRHQSDVPGVEFLTKSNDQKLPVHENNNIMCVAFAKFFDEKVHKIIDFTRTRVTTESVVLPLLPPSPLVRSPLNDLCPTDKGELQKIIEARPSKSCSLDVLPTLLKTTLPATLVRIVNTSLVNGEFPQAFKIVSVTSLLKITSLDQNVLNNYRPISNLAFIGKVIEKVVLKRLNLHMTENNLRDEMQSAYREQHSTETALMKVQHDIVHNLDYGHCVMLVLLDTTHECSIRHDKH